MVKLVFLRRVFFVTILSLSGLLSRPVHAITCSSVLSGVSKTPVSAQLVVPEIVALGIHPLVYKTSTSRLDKLSSVEDRYVLQIDIGRVSQDQFLKLKALYGNQSQVPYDAAKSYDLIDFLPPTIQALVNTTFSPKVYDTSKLWDIELDVEAPEAFTLAALQKNGVSFYTNCWGTTLEVLKSLRDNRFNTYTLSWPSRWTADSIFKEPQYSFAIRSDEARFGDVLAISMKDGGTTVLQHTALVLGKNLVYEKTDTSENDPYRLSLRSDVLAKYKDLLEGQAKIQYRRFRIDQEPMPVEEPEVFQEGIKKILLAADPQIPVDRLVSGCESKFGGGCDPLYTETATAKIVIDPKTGRARLKANPVTMKRFNGVE